MSTYIGTSTRYLLPQDAVRAELARRFLKAVSKLPDTFVVVVDGGSDPSFLKYVQRLGPQVQVYEQVGTSMHEARLEVFKHIEALAQGDPNAIVVWCEPEKVGFAKCIPALVARFGDEGPDMIMPIRTSLRSYPRFQEYTERAAALFVAELVGEDWDEFFGPVVFKAEWLWCFLNFDLEAYGVSAKYAGWAMNHGPRLVTKWAGANIKAVPVRYTHPRSQTKQEEGSLVMDLKRVEQLLNLLQILWIIAFKLGLTRQEPPHSITARLAQ